MTGSFRGILLGSEFKDITVDTGIVTSGLGAMRIFLVPDYLQLPWKGWCTRCHSDWSSTKLCFGAMERNRNFEIYKKSIEIEISLVGN
jgi:hypothetical protein